MNLSVTDRPSWSRSSCRHCHSWPCWGPTWWSCPPLFSLFLSCPPAPCQPPTSHHITAHGTQVWRPAGRDNLRDDSLWVTSDRDVCEALRWAAENSCGPVGRVDRRACGFEAALSTTELQATTLLVYNNLPLVLMLWPGNWQIYVCDKKFEGQWKTKKNGLGFEAALSTTELPTNILYTTPLFLCWSFWQVRKNIEELRLWLFSLMLRMGDAQLFLLLTQAWTWANILHNYCTVLPAIFISVLESFSHLLPWFLDLFQLLLRAFSPL